MPRIPQVRGYAKAPSISSFVTPWAYPALSDTSYLLTNPGGTTDLTVAQSGPGTFDLTWDCNISADGVRELNSLSWLASEQLGIDPSDPDWAIESELYFVDKTGVVFARSPQLGVGAFRGTPGSGTEDGRVAGLGFAGSAAFAATIRNSTGQSFGATAPYPANDVQGIRGFQDSLSRDGTDPLFGTTTSHMFDVSAGRAQDLQADGASIDGRSITAAPAALGDWRLGLFFGSASVSGDANVATIRARFRGLLLDADLGI